MDRQRPNKPHPTPNPENSHAPGRHDWSSLARSLAGAHGIPDPPSTGPPGEAEAEAEEPTFDSCFDDLNVVLSQSMEQPDPDPNLGSAAEGPRREDGSDPESGTSAARRGRAPRTSEIFRAVMAGDAAPSDSPEPHGSCGVEEAPAGEGPVPDLGLIDRPSASGDSGAPEDRHPEGRIPWGQILLLSYASVLTLALTWLFWTGRVPRAAGPAVPAEKPSAESAPRPAEPAADPEAPPLPSENIATIGKTVRLGDLEVTPLAVEAVPLELIRTIDPESRRREDRCLILRVRLTNLSDDQSFPPLDRNLVRDRDLRMFDPYIATSEGRSLRLFPLALDSEWSILGQTFPILRPGESAATFIAAEPGSADHLADEMTWRVRLRIGVYRTDMLGVRLTRKEVRRPRTISRDYTE
jgi:hypothetical protein